MRGPWRVAAAAAAALCLLATPVTAAPWKLSVEPPQGLPQLTRGGAVAFRTVYVFWQKDWKWSGLDTRYAVTAPLAYSVTGRNPGLHFDMTADVSTAGNRAMVWSWAFDVKQPTPDAIGGGLSFDFDLDTFRATLGEPELLPGNRGWTWGRAGGPRVELAFDPPLATVTFERGQKRNIRAYLYAGNVPAGARRQMATLTVSGDVQLAPSLPERFGPEDPQAWPADIADWRTSPVDLSFLNAAERPAGKRGFVKAQGDRLVFADGSPARFWGTNLTAWALFSTPEPAMKEAARRLSRLGFNLVRLHHHDSAWVNPNVFGPKDAPDTSRLEPAQLEKIDAWIAALKAEGIYVWLDLHVGRQLKAGDNVIGFDEIRKGKPTADLRGYNYVNDGIQQAMKRFNEAYVNRVNKHTGLAYKDEPAIMAMLITNENDLTHHFGNTLLPDKNVPWHNKIYMGEANAFAEKHRLPVATTWRSWEHGPSKIFLNDLEQRFNADMIRHLRAQGVKVPIATTNTWGYNPISSLPALTVGDVVDAHAYGQANELEVHPAYAANYVHWLAAGQVLGKPYTVTEWNVEAFPAPDRHAAPLYVAATAAHQGWDALMQYAYSQVGLTAAHGPSNWHAYNDPSMLATLPAAALMYRRGDVRPASTTYVFAPSKDDFYGRLISPPRSAALRTAAERGRLVIAIPRTDELPWLRTADLPRGAVVITDPDAAVLPAEAGEVVSDSGELRRDWANGVFVTLTPRTQAATGWLGGRRLDLGDVQIALSTRNASVAVQSLTDAPLGESRDVLISLGARSILPNGNRLPYRSEPVEGELTIRAPAGLRLYAANGETARRELPATYRDGRYRIRLDATVGSYWLMLAGAQP